MDRGRKCTGQKSNNLQKKKNHTQGAGRAFSTGGRRFMRSPQCKARFHRQRRRVFSSGTGVWQRFHSQHFYVVSHWRFSTGQPERKKKANPLLFVNTTVLTHRQAYKGRKFLSPANRDTTMYVFLCPSHKQSESEIKIPLTIMTQT